MAQVGKLTDPTLGKRGDPQPQILPRPPTVTVIIPFMNWLRQHDAEIGASALIVALTALFANFVKIWRSAEWWGIVSNALLASSTVFLACAAFGALYTWKKQEARKLALSLHSSTLDLVKDMENACRQGESVAKFYQATIGKREPHE